MATEKREWTYESYWGTVLGAARSARDVVEEFELVGGGLDEWLGTAESEARTACFLETYPEEWDRYHAKALRELEAAVADERDEEWMEACEGAEEEDRRKARVSDLLSALSDLDDGTGSLGIIVRQALADNPEADAQTVREIVCEADEDAAAEHTESDR